MAQAGIHSIVGMAVRKWTPGITSHIKAPPASPWLDDIHGGPRRSGSL
jgi:hypothetical protein